MKYVFILPSSLKMKMKLKKGFGPMLSNRPSCTGKRRQFSFSFSNDYAGMLMEPHNSAPLMMKFWREKINRERGTVYKLGQSDFCFGALDCFLAGLGRNQMCSAYCMLLYPSSPWTGFNYLSKEDNMWWELTFLKYILWPTRSKVVFDAVFICLLTNLFMSGNGLSELIYITQICLLLALDAWSASELL